MLGGHTLESIENIWPCNAVDQILDYFGKDNVSEISGRTKRQIQQDGNFVWRRTPKRKQELLDFQEGKKRVAVVSSAGSTGLNFHAQKGQPQRCHYILEMPWTAESLVQQCGRTHRARQNSAPVYKLVTSDAPLEFRLFRALEKRFKTLGALSRGNKRAGWDIHTVNLENIPQDQEAVAQNSGFASISKESMTRLLFEISFKQAAKKLNDYEDNGLKNFLTSNHIKNDSRFNILETASLDNFDICLKDKPGIYLEPAVLDLEKMPSWAKRHLYSFNMMKVTPNSFAAAKMLANALQLKIYNFDFMNTQVLNNPTARNVQELHKHAENIAQLVRLSLVLFNEPRKWIANPETKFLKLFTAVTYCKKEKQIFDTVMQLWEMDIFNLPKEIVLKILEFVFVRDDLDVDELTQAFTPRTQDHLELSRMNHAKFILNSCCLPFEKQQLIFGQERWHFCNKKDKDTNRGMAVPVRNVILGFKEHYHTLQAVVKKGETLWGGHEDIILDLTWGQQFYDISQDPSKTIVAYGAWKKSKAQFCVVENQKKMNSYDLYYPNWSKASESFTKNACKKRKRFVSVLEEIKSLADLKEPTPENQQLWSKKCLGLHKHSVKRHAVATLKVTDAIENWGYSLKKIAKISQPECSEPILGLLMNIDYK